MAANQDDDAQCFVGVDVGGTSIKIGLVTGQGQILDSFAIPTNQQLGPGDAIDRIGTALQPAFQQYGDRLCGVGLGTPGPLCTKTGMILDPVNMPGWRDFPIREELSAKLQLPVVYTNDANAAAYGEFWIGTGRDYDNMALLTLGTGVGAGIICHNELVAGATDHAAECGHLMIDYADDARMCSCGRTGHLEAYASATAVANQANQLADANPDSLLSAKKQKNSLLSAADVYDCAVQGDATAMALINETATYLARGINVIVHTVEPKIVLLGGAMDFGGPDSPIGSAFLARIDSEVRKGVFSRVAESLKIEFASLAGTAGWIGAAGLAKRDYDRTV